MRRRIDIAGQLPARTVPRLLVLAALTVGGLVAIGLTALIVIFLVTASTH